MSRNALIAGVVAIVVLIGGYWLWSNNTAETTSTDTNTQIDQGASSDAPGASSGDTDMTGTGTAGGGTGTQSGSYTTAQVAAHTTTASCWTIIDGNVYDLTTWIPQHPGGPQAILSLCGHDGSAAFHGQHDDAKRQADILATMKIGVLVQ